MTPAAAGSGQPSMKPAPRKSIPRAGSPSGTLEEKKTGTAQRAPGSSGGSSSPSRSRLKRKDSDDDASSASSRGRSESPSSRRRDSSETGKLGSRDGREGRRSSHGRNSLDGSAAGKGKAKAAPKSKAVGKDKGKDPKELVGKNAFTALGKVKDAGFDEIEDLLHQKLMLCCKIYDFNVDGDIATQQEKEAKRQTLLELVEHLSSNSKHVYGDRLMQDAVDMISANIFRGLIIKERSPLDIIDPEEDEPYQDNAWPHLEVVYEFVLRLVGNKEIDVKVAGKYINAKFMAKLCDMFDSDDPREREVVKTILQRIYTRFISLRTAIRRVISMSYYKAAYENEMQNGIAEQLEIMSNIINGFKVPLKAEHVEVLSKVLIPLHKVRSLPVFHENLTQCCKQFCEKDSQLIPMLLRSILQIWPNSLSVKQVLFLDEVEEILAITKSAEFQKVQKELIRRLALCIVSPQSQVAERVLALWKNDTIVKLFFNNRQGVFPTVIRSLNKIQKTHWHGTVKEKTTETLKILMESDRDLFDQCSADIRKYNDEETRTERIRQQRWNKLQELFEKRGGAAAAAREAASKRKAKDTGGGSRFLRPKESLPLPKACYGVAIAWNREATMAGVELEVQTVAVDEQGEIIDAVYANKLKALSGHLVHRPGESTAGQTTYGDSVWVTLAGIPLSVRILVFFVCAHTKGQLKDAADCSVNVVDDADGKAVASFPLMPALAKGQNGASKEAPNASAANLSAVAIIKRSSHATWALVRVEEYAKQGRHFMDQLEPLVGNVVRGAIANLPKTRQKVFIPMDRYSIVDLPLASCVKWAYLGISWDLAPGAANGVTLEVSAVFFTAEGQEMGAVTSENMEKNGVRHSGANSGLLGAGFALELEKVPSEVGHIFIMGNIHMKDNNFKLVQKPSCRIIDKLGTELVRYAMSEDGGQGRGLVLARLFRETGRKRWGFQSLGAAVAGTDWSTALDDLQAICLKSPQELQAECEAIEAETMNGEHSGLETMLNGRSSSGGDGSGASETLSHMEDFRTNGKKAKRIVSL